VSCFINNGINLAKHPGGTCTILATKASITQVLNNNNAYGIRFSVNDDGDGFTDSNQSASAAWTNSNSHISPISLHLFKKIIDGHGGRIGVDSKPNKG
jgi:nitrogen-specific signal transduction histidine kinase